MFEKHRDKIILLAIILFIAGMSVKSSKSTSELTSLVNQEAMKDENLDEVINENIFVPIVGEVEDPDLYELKSESRLKDLIEKAGGFTDGADQESVNLALKLEDEMMVRVPSVNDTEINVDYNNQILGISGTDQVDMVNINTASLEELQTLSGIGPKTAEKIVDFRENEKFQTIEDIMNVNGIGEKTFDDIKEKIRVN